MNKLGKLSLIFIVLSSFLSSACTKKASGNVLSPPEMENLLYDYHIAQAMANELPYEEVYKRTFYTEYVFRKHRTTQAVFDSSMVWYTRHADELTKIYENVNRRLKDQLGVLNHQIASREDRPQITQPGDTVDIWYGSRFYRLTPGIVTNKVKFNIPADTNFKVRDKIVWKVRYNFLSEDKKKIPATVMAMSIHFKNDSLLSVWKEVGRSGMDSLILKSDSDYVIKEIRGFIYYNDTTENFERNLLLDEISLIRYHELKKDSVEISEQAVQTSMDEDTLKEKSDAAREVAQKDSLLRRNIERVNVIRKTSGKENLSVEDKERDTQQKISDKKRRRRI